MEERMQASMQRMEERMMRQMQRMEERTMQQMQRMEERLHSSLQHQHQHLSLPALPSLPSLQHQESRRIDVDQVRQSEEEVLQLQQPGAAAVTPGLPHPVDGERGRAGPGRAADAVAPEDEAAGVMRAAPRCAICHERLTEELCAVPCRHVYHSDCTKQGISKNKCRKG
eukprot:GHVU01072534.1.p2 GENE.GHVU01072534.1~~GHVU01072534.1.p2  ORF type:complete len:169 (+),score=31.44 GHVU01072534.1:131-637(+)